MPRGLLTYCRFKGPWWIDWVPWLIPNNSGVREMLVPCLLMLMRGKGVWSIFSNLKVIQRIVIISPSNTPGIWLKEMSGITRWFVIRKSYLNFSLITRRIIRSQFLNIPWICRTSIFSRLTCSDKNISVIHSIWTIPRASINIRKRKRWLPIQR